MRGRNCGGVAFTSCIKTNVAEQAPVQARLSIALMGL